MAQQKSTNITWVDHGVTTDEREARNQHRGAVLWFTGLSGAGKSTPRLRAGGGAVSAGATRSTFSMVTTSATVSIRILGFSPQERTENIRRVGEVAALFADAGIICISAFISPYVADREIARKAAGDKFHEVYIKADVATCEQRDPKGLYKKARSGEIADFTGISAPYEAPNEPELVIATDKLTPEEGLDLLTDYVTAKLNMTAL